MGKLKLQMQVTVDGYVAGPNGEMDWMTFNWTDDINHYVADITEPVGTILLGKNLATGFIPHWAALPEGEAGGVDKMNRTPKVVFSRSAAAPNWSNARLATVADAPLADVLNSLKAETTADLITYGGASFAASLMGERLIDDLYLFVNPVAIGAGRPIFNAVGTKLDLTLMHVQPFDCGITALHHQPALR